jgi:hypothetical protein
MQVKGLIRASFLSMVPTTKVSVDTIFNKNAAGYLRSGGFSQISRIEGTLANGFSRLIEHDSRLLSAELQPDAVLLCAESFWEEQSLSIANKPLAKNYLKAFDLPHICCYANWLSGCSNVISSLRLALALLTSSTHRRILLAIGDRMEPIEAVDYEHIQNAYGDCALTLLISNDGPADFSIDALFIEPVKQSDYLHPAQRVLNSIQALRERFEAARGPLEQYDLIVCDNLHESLIELEVAAFGIARGKAYLGSRGDCGHSFSCDGLLNLAKLIKDLRKPTGMQIPILSVSERAAGIMLTTVL